MCTSSRSSGEKEYFDFPPNQNATSQVSLTLRALNLIFLDESGIVTVPPQAKLGPDLITHHPLGIRCWHIWISSLACVNHYSNHCVTCGMMRPPVQLWWPHAGTRKFCKPSGSTVRPCAHPTRIENPLLPDRSCRNINHNHFICSLQSCTAALLFGVAHQYARKKTFGEQMPFENA